MLSKPVPRVTPRLNGIDLFVEEKLVEMEDWSYLALPIIFL